MNRTELTQAIIWLDQIAAHAKAEGQKLREQIGSDARKEFEEQGTAPTWRIPDVATIAASVTHESVSVGDNAIFVRWVQSRYMTEVEPVLTVRTAWLTGFLARVRVDGEQVVDPDTGEVVPGLTVREGGRFAGVSIRPTAEAKAAFGAVAEHSLRKLALDALRIAGTDQPAEVVRRQGHDASRTCRTRRPGGGRQC